MKTSVLSFTPEQAAKATQYCENYTDGISESMQEVWEWTSSQFEDADKMSSPLQGATNKFLAEILQPKRILEIGSYSGFSVVAWHEATTKTQAEIITLEIEPRMINATNRNIDKYGLRDRVTLIEGPAQDTLKTLSGVFDIVFVDADKEGYEGYVKEILDRKLLSQNGIIICDNVFSRGLAIDTNAGPHLKQELVPYWIECGKAMKKLNEFCRNDPRIDSLVLPLYDGMSILKWKQ
ncbi:O-methyltransferase [Thozetella sp. PMI_491]|nr:O-methyltransferase [Thozetella sp. PMI_491]